MLKEISEEINKLKEDIVLKNILEKKLSNYKKQLEADEKTLTKLEESLKKEYKDVANLEKLTWSNLIATLMKNKDEKLEKEQQEYLVAKLKYDEFKANVEMLRENINRVLERYNSLNHVENEYKTLMKKKSELIKLYGNNDNKAQLTAIEKSLDEQLKEKKEIEEAEIAGKELLRAANNAKSSLDEAKNWGIFDIAGGDMLSSMVKHNKINEAQSHFRRVGNLINRFNKELGDIQIEGISFSNTTIAFDIFFDNIFTDFSVQNKINASLDKVRHLIRCVENTLSDLNTQKQIINSNISNLKKDYNYIVESV